MIIIELSKDELIGVSQVVLDLKTTNLPVFKCYKQRGFMIPNKLKY